MQNPQSPRDLVGPEVESHDGPQEDENFISVNIHYLFINSFVIEKLMNLIFYLNKYKTYKMQIF